MSYPSRCGRSAGQPDGALGHGGYSSKNMLGRDGNIFLIEFEVVHWGDCQADPSRRTPAARTGGPDRQAGGLISASQSGEEETDEA